MFTASTAEALLCRRDLAITVLRPDGQAIFCNEAAQNLFPPQSGRTFSSITQVLTAGHRWDEILSLLRGNSPVVDEPVLIESASGGTECCYLTAIPQWNPVGDLDSTICIWAGRRNASSTLTGEVAGETVTEYTRDLEAILEHRTYHQMMLGDRNDDARAALDRLSVGIMFADTDGEITYRNDAMDEIYGLRVQDLLSPNVKHLLDPDAQELFIVAARANVRKALATRDPGGKPAYLSLLPVQRPGQPLTVVMQYTRVACGDDTSRRQTVHH